MPLGVKRMGSSWAAHFERERARYGDGEARVAGLADPDERQRQLTRMGNAATGAGLALIMDGRRDGAADWLARAADRYRESFPEAPAGSWGRPIGAVKARVLARAWEAAAEDARWTLATGAAGSDSPIGRYAACLANLVLGADEEARGLVASLVGRDDFPDDVARSLLAIAGADAAAYSAAVVEVLRSFETREAYLEDVAVADTVIVLQAFAGRRGLVAELSSSLLPPR
jgi:hypothetical protein